MIICYVPVCVCCRFGGLLSKFQSTNYPRNLALDSQSGANHPKAANLIQKKHVRKPFIIFSGEKLGDLMKKNPGKEKNSFKIKVSKRIPGSCLNTQC